MSLKTRRLSFILAFILLISLIPINSAMTAAQSSWEIMFDWENEGEEKAAITSTTTSKGDNYHTYVKDLALYSNNGEFPNTVKPESKKAIWVYNQLAASCNPNIKSTPATITLDAQKMATAKSLRMLIHNKEKTYANEVYYVGVVMNGKTYYSVLDKAKYHTFNYYNFLGKVMTAVSSNESITITPFNLKNITAIAVWVQTQGYSALVIDDIEYSTGIILDSEDTSVYYTMDTDLTPDYADDATIKDLNDNSYDNVLAFDKSDFENNVAYFSLPSDALTKASPSKLSFDIRADKETAVATIKAFGDDFEGGHTINGIPTSFDSQWKTVTVDFSENRQVVDNNLTSFGFKFDSQSSADAIYIDNIVLEYKRKVTDAEKNIQYYKDNMKLDWSDEFDGDSLDMNTWSYEPSTVHRNKQVHAYNDSLTDNSNVQIIDGNLVLTARKETKQCGHADHAEMTEEEHIAKYGYGTTFNYSSGAVRSTNKKTVKRGLIETRVKAPEGEGLWCSVWMCGVDKNNEAHWPWTGEIDIIEFVGSDTRRQFSSLHYQNPSSSQDYNSASNRKSAGGNKYTLPSGSFSDSYHTIGMMWTETYVSFYVDDVIYQTIDITPKEFYAFRDYEFYFIVSNPVGGTMAPNVTAKFPQSFYIDYIRVYKPYDSEVVDDTNDSVTLREREGYEYSKDGKNWQSSPVFSGLQSGTEYTFYQRMKKGAIIGSSNISNPITYTIDGSNPPSTTTPTSSTTKPPVVTTPSSSTTKPPVVTTPSSSTTQPSVTTTQAPTTKPPVVTTTQAPTTITTTTARPTTNNKTLKPAKVKKLKLKPSKKKVTITFKAAKNAKKYIIKYSYKKNMKAAKYKTVKKCKTVIKKLKSGKKIYVQVQGVNGKVKGKLSAKKFAKIK